MVAFLELLKLGFNCFLNERVDGARSECMAAHCEIAGPSEYADQDSPTIGQTIREFLEVADNLDQLTPPAVVEAYHEAVIFFLRAYAVALGESGDDTEQIPETLSPSEETDRRTNIAIARAHLEYLSLPQPIYDRIEDCIQ